MASVAAPAIRSACLPTVRFLAAAALVTMVAAHPLSAQSVEERARAAAEASRARTADSDALLENVVTPGMSGQPIATVDGRHSFSPTIACQKTATLLEVVVQPSATGDLGSVLIARDTDFDSTHDIRTKLPVPVSGVCANGVMSCQPGSWNQCRSFRWDVDAAKMIKLSQVAITDLAGCYCINNSCGSNLAWSNMASVLGDLGGGMVGALTAADPRIGVAKAAIDGPVIRYTGAQTTACSADPQLPQSSYRASPTTMAGDALAASASSGVFQALTGSAAGLGRASVTRRCTIAREIEIDAACRTSERLVDNCSAQAGDEHCRLNEEVVDDVTTVTRGARTGFSPLPQTRLFGTGACTAPIMRDFFLVDRRYICATDTTAGQAQPDLSRGTYIIDHSTETMIADRMSRADGGTTTTTRPFALPDHGPVSACESICKTRGPRVNDAAAPAGVTGSQQNDPASFDTFYHACTTDNRCPAGPGETVVTACGCLDDFPEAVVMMQTVRLAGADLACSASPR